MRYAATFWEWAASPEVAEEFAPDFAQADVKTKVVGFRCLANLNR